LLYRGGDEWPEPIELARRNALRNGFATSKHYECSAAAGAEGDCVLMSRIRLILLGLLAVVAVSLVASASALGPPAACGGTVTTTPNYCVAGYQLENSAGEPISEEVEGTNGVAVLKAKIASSKAEIVCSKGKSTGTIEDGASGTVGKSTVTIKFEECQLVKPTSCKLSPADEMEIETTLLKGELALNSGRIEDRLESKTGAFAGISIEGKESSCVIAEVGRPNTFNVTGSQLCEVDSSNAVAETAAASHEIDCSPSGGSLKIGGNLAEMSDDGTAELSGPKAHDAWSIKEHT
jgi:hypothetical protein